MKILLIFLTMIFIGFSANANTVKIISEKCKKYELTKLKTNKLNAIEKKDADTCREIMWTVLVKGGSLCRTLRQLMHKGILNFNDQTTMNYLGGHTNSEIFDYDEVITKFIKWAEENPRYQDNYIGSEKVGYFFFYKSFPCNLKNPY